MVTEEIIKSKAFIMNEYEIENSLMRVNAEEMVAFSEKEKELAKKIAKMKLLYESKHQLKPMEAYDAIEAKCQINQSTLKSTINGKIRPTRNFLYKLVVGLHLSLEEANELFALCNGELREDCRADYIVINALKDQDDIYQFIEDFQKYTGMKIEMRVKE